MCVYVLPSSKDKRVFATETITQVLFKGVETSSHASNLRTWYTRNVHRVLEIYRISAALTSIDKFVCVWILVNARCLECYTTSIRFDPQFRYKILRYIHISIIEIQFVTCIYYKIWIRNLGISETPLFLIITYLVKIMIALTISNLLSLGSLV